VTEREIIGYCRTRLAAYKVPRAVAFVEDLPKTSTGKIMRRELRNLDTV
jgi:long-chain acyl-CoA synthetase